MFWWRFRASPDGRLEACPTYTAIHLFLKSLKLPREPHILYLAPVLPKRSETFVYREVLGLRGRGVRVSVASVHPPERDLGDARLDALADEALVVYGHGRRGKLGVFRDGARQSLIGSPAGLAEVPPLYWPKYLFQWEAGHALAYRLRRRFRGDAGITHIHAHMAHVPTTIAMACAEAMAVSFSFTGHAADLFRDRSALRTKLRRAAFVSCISEWHRGYYRDLVPGLGDAELPVIRCGVDLDEFSPVDPGGAPGGSVLAVGRLVPKKGFDVLIEAVAKLAATHASGGVTVKMVGDGPEEANLKALAAKLNVADRIDFVGAKSNAEVRELMGRAALFVLPCREAADGDRDGIPVVLMEAMARRVCVVSGDLPTIRELVADNETGRMVEPGSADELADAVGGLLGDAAQRERLAEAGRARVAEEFSLVVTLDRLQAAFAAAAAPYDVGRKQASAARHA